MTRWIIADGRTGEPVGVTTYSTKERAEQALRYYMARHDAGRIRVDLHGKVPHWEVQHG